MPDKKKTDKTANLDRKHFNRRLSQLKNERQSFVGVWRDLRDYIAPFRGRFDGEKRNDGKRRDANIYNNTPVLASRILQAGMNSGVTDPSNPWFRFKLPDVYLQNTEVKTYLAEAESAIQEILHESNFYDAAAIFYEELLVFGTAVMLSFEDTESVVDFHVPTIGEYYLGNDKRNRSRIFYREFDLTVGQIVEEYGLENCSKQVQGYHNRGSLDIWVTIVQAIEFNDDRIYGMKDAKNKKYRSVHYEKAAKDDSFLRVSGFDDFPGTPVRWSTVGSDVYGTGQPGLHALGDSKQLQSEQFQKAEGLALNLKPPIQGPGSAKNSNVMYVPGQVTFNNQFNGGGKFEQLVQTRVPLGEIIQDIRETEQRINRAFFVDLFLPLLSQDRPSDMKTGVADGLSRESLIMLGPVLQRLNNEWLKPTLDRVFMLAEKAGRIPPAPEILKDADIEIEYVSTLQQAQKAVAIGAMERFTGLLGAWAQFDPEVLDKIDFDKAADKAGALLGVPPGVVRSGEETSAVRKGRQDAQQQQTLLENAASAASTAKDLSAAKIEEGTLLSTLPGG